MIYITIHWHMNVFVFGILLRDQHFASFFLNSVSSTYTAVIIANVPLAAITGILHENSDRNRTFRLIFGLDLFDCLSSVCLLVIVTLL